MLSHSDPSHLWNTLGSAVQLVCCGTYGFFSTVVSRIIIRGARFERGPAYLLRRRRRRGGPDAFFHNTAHHTATAAAAAEESASRIALPSPFPLLQSSSLAPHRDYSPPPLLYRVGQWPVYRVIVTVLEKLLFYVSVVSCRLVSFPAALLVSRMYQFDVNKTF